jgi:hypothetical protein
MGRYYCTQEQHGVYADGSGHGHQVGALRLPRNTNHYTGAFGDHVILWHWLFAASVQHCMSLYICHWFQVEHL